MKCKNGEKLGLVRASPYQFDVPVFQITGSEKVTFQCTVRVYELEQTLPVCTTRKRREANEEIMETEGNPYFQYITMFWFKNIQKKNYYQFYLDNPF